MTENQEQTPEKLKVTVNDSSVELFMSYGLLNRLAKIGGSAEDLSAIYVTPDMQERIIIECLCTKMKPHDKEKDEVEIDDFELTPDEAQKIVDWAGAHIVDFFLRAFNKATSANQRMEPMLNALMSSSGGSETSTSTTPSAGHSEQSQAS
jgi:hypothetical protein